MKKHCLFIVFIFWGSFSIYASSFNINGIVKDSTTKLAIPFCEVLLRNTNDSLITGCITDMNGYFSLNITNQDSISIQLRSFTYNSKRIELVLSENKTVYSLGELYLSVETKVLKGIEVSALRPFLEKKFDRDVFNMSEGAVASARNIFDLLKKIPGIVVDEENSIVKFKGNIATVKVNNTPSERMFPKLEMIPIANIDKIEVIDPTMRGKGSGASGAIINIRIKKIVLDGLSGSAGGRMSVGDSLLIKNQHIYSNINYKKKKFIFYNNLGDWGSNGVNNSKSWGSRIDENGSFLDTNSHAYNYQYISMWEWFGIQYAITEKSQIDFQIGGSSNLKSESQSLTYANVKNQVTNTLVDQYSLISNNRKKKGNANKGIGITYTSEIDTLGKELTIDYWGSFFKSHQLIENITDNLNSVDLFESKDDKYGSVYSWLSVFYNHPISNKTQWNIECSNSTTIDNEKANFIRNNAFVYSSFRDNKMNDYENSISFHYGTTIKKLKIDGGASFLNKITQNKRTIFYSKTYDTLVSIQKIFNKLVPTGTIKYNINDKKELKFSYDCNYQMPYTAEMFEPYIDSSNMRFWSKGNPSLKPAFIQSVYLGYTFTDEEWNTSIQAFIKKTHNNFTNVDVPLDSVKSLSMPLNLEENQSVGLFYSYYQTFGKSFTLSFNTNWFYSKVDISKVKPYLIASGVLPENLIRYSWNYDLSSNFEYRKGRNYASANIYYNSKQISTMGFDMPKFDMNLSVSRSFLKNNLRVAISFDNLLFGIYKPASIVNVMGRDMNSENYSNNIRRSVGFSLSYNFREGDRNTSSKSGRLKS